jgi:hypothetical protein
MLTAGFDEAFRYAHELHRAQRRNGARSPISIPCIGHSMGWPRCSSRMAETGTGRSPPFLHDGPDDHGGVPGPAGDRAQCPAGFPTGSRARLLNSQADR